jgi:asparagine synthase (glutamine-hydrolysing)
MPGISLRYNVTNLEKFDMNNVDNELFLETSKSLIHNDSYKREILLRQDAYAVVCTRYPEYPIRILDNNKYWVCVEGKFYGKNDLKIENEIFDLIEIIFSANLNADDARRKIAEWLLDTDGDFVLYALNKSNNDFIIMNDLLGRLPLYTYSNGSEIVISREIQLMFLWLQKHNHDGNNLDKMGIAQFLLFSHTLGTRTLLRNVNRLEPSSILMISNGDSKIKQHSLHVFNFENKKYANQSIKKNVKELVPLFLEACKNRVDVNARNTISLSGGFDSRAIAMSLSENDIPYYAITSPEPNWKPVLGRLSETEIAEKLAKVMNIELEKFDIMKPKAENFDTLLNNKNGLIYLGHGFLVRLLEEIRSKHPSSKINLFTGHGGDISFTNLLVNINDIDDCVWAILSTHGQFPISQIMALTGIKKSELREEIKNILQLYPEDNPGQKLVHYLFFEINAKFSFEIEDMNRFYFWTVCPFYSVPFFRYIFNCSDRAKGKLALYREFLISISPKLAAISNSDWGCSITSLKFRIYQHVLHLSKNHRMFRKYLTMITNKKSYKTANNYGIDSPIIRCITEQIESCNPISNYLSITETKKILSNATEYTYEAIDNLLTMTSLLEKVLCNKTTLNKYF